MLTLPSVFSLKTTAIAGAVSLAMGLAGGWVLHDKLIYEPHLAKDAKAVLHSEQKARSTEAAGTVIAGDARDAHDTRQADIRTVTQTIVKEVPHYVSSTVTCPATPAHDGVPAEPARVAVADVSVGFGLLHDAAATGHPPLPPGPGVDLDADRGTGMPAVAETIVANYGVCLGWREEARSWRDWYARESAAWPVK